MSDPTVGAVVFFALALLAVSGAAGVAFFRNIVHSAFSLLATFLGVAGIYAFLSCDLLAVVQLLVYVGGVLVLILFAVMLTSRVSEVKISNRSVGLLPGFATLVAMSAMTIVIAFRVFWGRWVPEGDTPTVNDVGDALLGKYVLPFEVISILLLAVLIGAVLLTKKAPRAGGNPEGGTG